MTPEEHYRIAERLIADDALRAIEEEGRRAGVAGEALRLSVALAQVHATLATAQLPVHLHVGKQP